MNFDKLDRFISQYLSFGAPGCDCCVYLHGKEVFRKQYGMRDRENKLPVQGDERYYIYSCSKPITCVTALQQWEKGLFKLDDALADYMPEFKEMTVRTDSGIVPAKKRITIRHLFTMTAGLDYNLTSPSLLRAFDETAGACPTRETMKYLAQEPLCFEPGDHWQYSLCHDVLAALLEVVSGKKFETLVEENIFTPLGMKNSTFLLPATENHTIAPLYYGSPHGVLPRPLYGMIGNNYRLGSKYASGGAGAVSTVDDYMKFLEAWRTDILIKPETRQMMTTGQLTEAMRSGFWLNDNYSYGLGVRVPQTDLVSDIGWGGAAGAFLGISPAMELSFFFAQHVLGTPQGQMRHEMLHTAIDCVKNA